MAEDHLFIHLKIDRAFKNYYDSRTGVVGVVKLSKVGLGQAEKLYTLIVDTHSCLYSFVGFVDTVWGNLGLTDRQTDTGQCLWSCSRN